MMAECHVGYDLLMLQTTGPCTHWRRRSGCERMSHSREEETIGLWGNREGEICEGVRMGGCEGGREGGCEDGRV